MWKLPNQPDKCRTAVKGAVPALSNVCSLSPRGQHILGTLTRRRPFGLKQLFAQFPGSFCLNTKIRCLLAPSRCRDQPNRTIGCTLAAWSFGVSADTLTEALQRNPSRVRACETSSTVGWPTLRHLPDSQAEGFVPAPWTSPQNIEHCTRMIKQLGL